MKHEVIHTEKSLATLEWLQARNDILDAFADLETRIAFILKRAKNLPPKGQCLGQRLEIFRTVKANSEIAAANLARRDTLVNSIAELLPVRADIVHSRMKIHLIDGSPVGIFVNSHDANEKFPQNRLLTLAEMRCLVNSVQELTESLSKLSKPNPPSSPPPPSPGAAAGP